MESLTLAEIQQLLVLTGGFAVVALAANRIARFFQRIKLPLITGLLFVGIICGPFVLDLIPAISRDKLTFISDIALSYIAFAAGAELYLKELRDRFRSIKWITAGQLVITFLVSALTIYLLQNQIPFIRDLSENQRLIVALMSGVIFIARSPASAIAIINEVRAKGPFTHTVLGVTVLTDFIVIVMFAIIMSFSLAIDKGEAVKLAGILIVLLEIFASFILGFLLSQVLRLLMFLRLPPSLKTLLVLSSGYSVYLLYYLIRDYTEAAFGKAFLIEPLLICILGSFLLTNYTKSRHEFIKLLKDSGTPIYAMFFTLAGAVLSLDIIANVWVVTLIFFLIRLVTIMGGSFLGGFIAKDPPLSNRVGWMPYITQAGVGLGLALIVARTFPEWGFEFATIITSMIVVNQVVGPPLFKWALSIVKESHPRADTPEFDGIRDAIIFGLEPQSVALARQLIENNWEVKIATIRKDVSLDDYPDIDVRKLDSFSLENLESMEIRLSEAVVLMMRDEENLEMCELIYEEIGTKDIVVRLNHRYNFEKFHKLGALIVEPSTAIVSLLDHFVRSPQAASLLLGLQEGQDSMDLEVLNPNLHGIALRDLRLPSEIIVLSIMRSGQMLITHGYTRLRMGDVVTVVGSKESLNNLSLRFDG